MRARGGRSNVTTSDPTEAASQGADPADGQDDAETETCATCGAPIDEYEWHPIRGRRDDDGEFALYPFCSDGCVESWDGD